MTKLALSALLLLASAITSCLAASPSSSASIDLSITPLDQVPDPGPALVIRLKQLADAGVLFDPPSVAEVLQTELTVDMREDVSQPADCSKIGASKSYRITTVEPPQAWWYHSLSSGAGSLEVPAGGMHEKHRTGETEFRYGITRRVKCADIYRMQDHTVAELFFLGLPAFACVTLEGLKVVLPQSKPVLVMDGPFRLEYEVATDEFGTVLDFDFEPFVRCASSISMRQDQESGLRFKRAQYAYVTCRQRADRDFCSSVPPFTWGDGAELDKMDQHAAEVCGTLNQKYLREPATGQPAKAPRYGGKLPCDVPEGNS